MKVVLITGISTGFGFAIAQRLAKGNYRVYGTVRREVDPLPNVNYIYMDVVSDESVKQAIDRVYQKEGRIDVLINNAGVGIAAPLEFTKIDDIQYLMEVNFIGVVRVTQSVLPIMRKQSDGLIITISSIGGLIGLPYQGIYSASKFALEGFCQALYSEVKQFNIKVLVINPGDFSTQFTANRKCPENDDLKEVYQTFRKTLSLIEQDEKNGLHPELLANRIEKLISKKSKPTRLIIALPLQKVSVFLKRILPEKVFLWIIKKHYLID